MIAYLRQERTDFHKGKVVTKKDIYAFSQQTLASGPDPTMLSVQAGIAPGGNRHVWLPSRALHSIYHPSTNLVRPIFWIYAERSHFSLPPSQSQSNFAIISHLDFFFLTFDFVSPLVGILVPWPGVEPVPSAVKVWSPNYWTTREFSLTQTLVMSPFFLLTPI